MALTEYRSSILPRRTPTVRLPGGYQTGDPTEIARRYSGNATALQSNLRNIAAQPAAMAPMPTGAAGPTGDEGASGGPTSSIIDTAPMAAMPTGTPNAGTPPPQGNATQRWSEAKEAWKAAGGTSRSFNKANVERGVRPEIDGRAAPDPKASTASADIRQSWGWSRNSSTDLPY